MNQGSFLMAFLEALSTSVKIFSILSFLVDALCPVTLTAVKQRPKLTPHQRPILTPLKLKKISFSTL